MQSLIVFFVICLLEKYVSSYACVAELTVILYCCGSDIDIDATYRTVFMLDAINSLDAFENIFDMPLPKLWNLNVQPSCVTD